MTSTKERILEASTELFRRQGYTGTGIKQILGEADAPYGSLYHHFPGGKDELTAATVRRAGAFYQDLVVAVIDAEPDLVSGIRAMFTGAAAALVDTDYADACPIETIALEVASTNDPLRAATAEVFESWLEAFTERGVAGGMERARARATAHVVVAALEGAFILCRSSRSTDALEACGAAMADVVSAAVLRSPAGGRPRRSGP